MMSNERTIQDLQKAVAAASEGASGVNASANSMQITSTYRSTAAAGSAISIRNEYNKGHYDTFRPSEKVPVADRDIMIACNNSYYTVGIVRNIVDLMADFCIKGIDWSHTNRNVQAFYRTWFQNINGIDVSERFCNYMVRLGNNCIYTNYMKVPDSTAQQWKKTKGSEFSEVLVSDRKIPSKYIFMDITALSELYPEIGKFTNKRLFMLSLANGLVNSITNTSSQTNANPYDISRVVRNIPSDLKKKMTEYNGNIVFEEGELKIFHYKKDDWDSWAKPLIYSILEPLILLKKMHLADMSALDGAISNIRLWRLGYIDQNNALNSIIPTKAMLNKVREVVLSNISGGTLDIFWGPELDFKESASEVHKFLGPEKYQHVMAMIYDGMGIPASLTGGGAGDGFTNNFISMKVLIEKLNYLRSKLVDFWTEEAKVVQKAMGFSHPAKLVFDDAILSDEGQYKKLLIDLYDRDVISLESLREEFNLIDPIEASRVLREMKRRTKEKSPERSGPYHDPMWKIKLESEMIKTGVLDPDTLGVDAKQKDIIAAVKGPGDGGRPSGAKDQTKRKQKVVRPRTSAEQVLETQVWAKENLDKISEIITPAYVKAKGREYARELTHAEADELENIKLGVLGSHAPFSEVSEETIDKACSEYIDTSELKVVRDTLLERFVEKFNRKPTIEDRRVAACAAYSLLNN
jgi:hypothetical protein